MFLPLTFMLLLAACQREEPLPLATSAAKAIYQKYADRQDLTVALVGGYHGFNAVMFEAPNRESWMQLCDDFGVRYNEEDKGLDTANISTLTRSYVMDSVGTIGEAFAQILGELIREETVASSVVTQHVEYDHGALVDSVADTSYSTRGSRNDPLMQTALQHGDSGYLVASDSQSLTLCLFFYSTMEEMAQIIDHVVNIHAHQ